VDISLNGTLITASTNTYPYRVIMETLLSYGEDVCKNQAGTIDSIDGSGPMPLLETTA